ncbi:hypothetical protein A9Q88_10285 [Gammaproteobacteria bacterium 50_400_T64]|nr:hypothetical protein A9Q88_10285 [Gammaproteobacteria bacterium 50_400_T64]
MHNYHIFEYLYRDAGNFKAFGQLLLTGIISEKYIDELRSYLEFDECFIAEQVNIPTLYSQLWKYSNGPTLEDHSYHEFSSLISASDEEISSMPVWGNTEHLLDNFRQAHHQLWDCSLSVHTAVG